MTKCGLLFSAMATVSSFLLFWSINACAGYGRYSLTPSQVAEDVYVLWGKQEPLTWENGGNIVNTGFIIGSDSVLVIDTGPTQLYAAEMINTIRSLTNVPIRYAIVTHHHPDHSFGIQEFKKNNINVYMHQLSKKLLKMEGPTLLGFMESLIGSNWVTGTHIDKPTHTIRSARILDIGDRKITILPFSNGHTPGDLAVFDHKTRTLFSGDLVFYGRAASVPHANVSVWQDHLQKLSEMKWNKLIPGHGPIVTNPEPLKKLSDYLSFLQRSTAEAVARGDSLAEVLQMKIPGRFSNLALVRSEFQRSMASLFRKLESEEFNSTIPSY